MRISLSKGKNCFVQGVAVLTKYDPSYQTMLKVEVLIARRALLSGEDEPKKKKTLFHTRCRCNVKVCNAIFDSGGTNNIIYK